MGWFWTSNPADSPEAPVNPPRNEFDKNLGGTFWAPRADIWAEEAEKPTNVEKPKPATDAPRCPVDHSKIDWFKGKKQPERANDPSGKSASTEQPASAAPSLANPAPAAPKGAEAGASACPVDHSKFTKANANASACPVDHTKYTKHNNMPHLVASKLPGQKMDLPTERTMSSIPRGEQSTEGFWEYPSPQQMLNAMVRKSGREGIPEDAVESMVDVHNFLNEGVWEEVLEWEKPHTELSSVKPRLLKFQGRPGELSPRARMLQALGWIYPAKFGVPPPFDRHDWTVLRAVPGHKDDWTQVRYVIDFYEIPDGDSETPMFTVDVRPAVDSLSNIYDRARVAWGPTIGKAMGWS